MNKKIEEYKKRANKIVKTIKLLAICIFVLGILISIIQYKINLFNTHEVNQKSSNQNSNYVINLQDNTVIYQNYYDINIKINEFNEQNDYKIVIKMDDKIIIEQSYVESENSFNINLVDEGQKKIGIIIYENNEEKYNKTLNLYYIEPYKKQYLDTMSNKGIGVHFISDTKSNSFEDYSISLDMINKLGIKNIRTDIFRYYIVDNNGNFNFSYYDKWNKVAEEKGINVLLIFNGFGTRIDNEEKVEMYKKFVTETIMRSPQIKMYEILNEPNILINIPYYTDEELEYYTRLVKISREIVGQYSKVKILAGGLGIKSLDSQLTQEEFFDKYTNNGGYKYTNSYSYHTYDGAKTKQQNERFINRIMNNKSIFNGYGGFIRTYLTEYGISVYGDITEEIQADKLLQQTVITDKYGIDFSSIYNFWNIGTDAYNGEHNYGLVKNDYTPKLSYYSMKNYYQNTNGAEYIGTLNIQSGLEAHVYDKDGKPIIIAWSDNTDNTYDFTLNGMTVKDLYGKDIQADESGKIQITTSPVYLYNVGNQYFYQAISNMITEKYDEFKEKFSEQISKVADLETSINNIEQTMKDIYNNSIVEQEMAISLMEQHYNLGNEIIEKYKSGSLDVEYVTLSSMLDMLDDIGDSYEDLVTVSVKTREADLPKTLNAITEAETLINNNEDLDMVYPRKILDFSQDFYDKASYINGLEEENDIKNGLIVSKNLHSLLLANWGTQFANLYIDEYIEKNPVEVKYSTTNLTNQDVTATLITNANIQVTNNSNSKEHVFKNNDTFEFEYILKGRNKKIQATVSNIDKILPEISQVENDRLYMDNVTPNVSDENLLKVEMYKDSSLVDNYQLNTSVVEDGSYKIVALDKAGNETSIEFYISRKPADITYSETSLTNKDVTATLTSNFDFEVNNNSHQKKYTFVKNDTFEFDFTIKGLNLKLMATVNNIDKKAPLITGVENEKIYMDKAKPIITDENLQDVKLYQNEIVVQNYNINSEIKEEGIYKIIATDKAGNRTTINFYIMTNPSQEYQMKDSYILNINYNTYKHQFDEKFNTATKYKILRKGKQITDQDKIITGDILQNENGKSYTLIVNGDINKDGNINIFDLNKLRICILKNEFNLDEEQKLAADTNLDGQELGIKDLVKLRILILLKDIEF